MIHLLIFLLFFGGLAVWLVFLFSRPPNQALFTKPLYVLPGGEKVVVLTFDDGPLPYRTPLLLEMLKKHGIKATFFMMGERMSQYPDIARQVVAEGHLIGNHSWDHSRLTFRSPAFVRKQITMTDSLIRAAGQQEVRFFRPPYLKKFIVLPLVLNAMKKVMVTGNINPPAEYNVPCDPHLVADQVMEQVVPGSIIYLHDGYILGDPGNGSAEFIEAVEQIIVRLRDSGYSFVTL
ncbi:MAG: polysaccharide deacetylase family protein [Bacteroidales bacterium]|nr:polysaccharide deacetylase family protein [Bacteroidales bacterium]